MSFAGEDDVQAVVERFVSAAFAEAMGKPFPSPVPHMSYDEAITRFGGAGTYHRPRGWM